MLRKKEGNVKTKLQFCFKPERQNHKWLQGLQVTVCTYKLSTTNGWAEGGDQQLHIVSRLICPTWATSVTSSRTSKAVILNKHTYTDIHIHKQYFTITLFFNLHLISVHKDATLLLLLGRVELGVGGNVGRDTQRAGVSCGWRDAWRTDWEVKKGEGTAESCPPGWSGKHRSIMNLDRSVAMKA